MGASRIVPEVQQLHHTRSMPIHLQKVYVQREMPTRRLTRWYTRSVSKQRALQAEVADSHNIIRWPMSAPSKTCESSHVYGAQHRSYSTVPLLIARACSIWVWRAGDAAMMACCTPKSRYRPLEKSSGLPAPSVTCRRWCMYEGHPPTFWRARKRGLVLQHIVTE